MNSETRKPGNEAAADQLTEQVTGAAIRVHTELGPGFLETIYEEALAVEFRLIGLQFERQKPVPIIEKSLVVELKATTALEKVHFAVLRSYLKALGVSHGLLLNFAGTRLIIKRVGREFHSRIVKEEEISF